MRERTVDTNGCGGTQACINDQTLVRHRPKRVNRHSNPLADIVIVRIVSPQRGCRKTGARCQREVEGGRYDKYLACMGGGAAHTVPSEGGFPLAALWGSHSWSVPWMNCWLVAAGRLVASQSLGWRRACSHSHST